MIVDIGDFRIQRAQRTLLKGCQHKQLTLHDDGDYVTCDDCQKQISTYAALRMLVERWALLQAKADSQQQAIATAAGKTVELRAAQFVEKAWRSRSMAPSCPHCNEAIFPSDGFGRSMVNKTIALARREARRRPAPLSADTPAGKDQA